MKGLGYFLHEPHLRKSIDEKMTEKEKMLKQMLYDANYDKDLLEQRTKAKELCYDFNNLRPSDEKGQKRS